MVALVVGATVSAARAQCQLAKFVADVGAPNDLFGFAVAAGDETVAVGAVRDDAFGVNAGATYLFERSGRLWLLDAKLGAIRGGGLFGRTLGLDQDTIVIGATSAWTAVFSRSATVWSPVVELIPEGQVGRDFYGWSAALDGDVAVVGAPQDSEAGGSSGAAYVFERSAGGWSQTAKLMASDAYFGEEFGSSVDIDGDVIVVGAPNDDDLGNWSGSAYVFERIAGVWTQTAKLLASDGGPFHSFGASVAVEGLVAIAGAPSATGLEPIAGAVYVFERDPSGQWTQRSKIIASEGQTSDHLGWSVAMDGGVIVAGPPDDRDHEWRAGAAYVFARDPGREWFELGKIWADDGAADDRLGYAVGISDSVAVIGAPFNDEMGEDAGAAYVFAVAGDANGNGVVDLCECRADLDADQDVDLSDLGILLADFGCVAPGPCVADINGDRRTDLIDLRALLETFGTVCRSAEIP